MANPWLRNERPAERTAEGQVRMTMRQMSQRERVMGSHGRSGQQLDAWVSVYGPVNDDGYPKPPWDHATGAIDRSAALYMRDHGYDLTEYARRHWTEIALHLDGKIRVIVGDMDTDYLNLAVYRFERFMTQEAQPPVHAAFTYGRPMKG